MAYALEHYGTLPLVRVLEPAIRIAEQGYPISQLQHDLTKREREHLANGSAAPFFLKDSKHLYRTGAHFSQPVLGTTLRRIADAGVMDFYRGDIARHTHEDMANNNGFIRDDDLAQVPWPIERIFLSTNFNHDQIFTFGPPGAGRVLIEMLNVLNQFSPDERDPDTAQGTLLLAEMIRRGQFDRHDRPYDPHYYWQVTGERMLDSDYAKQVADELRSDMDEMHGETTHLSVMDKQGNVVGLTQSIERVYGSYEVCSDLGFLYNNYMSAYEHHDMTHPYYLRPNTPPWGSVAPTIVMRNNKPWVVLGSPGSERIAPAVTQVILRLEKQSPYEAVAAPRLHCSIDGKVSLEAARMRGDIPALLRKYGFEIIKRDPYSFYLGCIGLVMKDEDGYTSIADPRRDGSAGGPN